MKNVGYSYIIHISLLYHDSYIIRYWLYYSLAIHILGIYYPIDIYTSQSKYIVNL